jgi:hypothetical protein
MNREDLIYKLTIYLLNKAYDIKGANKETQKKWISKVKHYGRSEYLDPSYNKWFPYRSEMCGVRQILVWDEIRKANLQYAISILSDIEEVLWDIEEDIEEKALIYLMNEFVKENPTLFKIFFSYCSN